MLLQGVTVAISGASGLLGAGISRVIAQNGGRVLLGDVSDQKGIELESEIGKDKAKYVHANLIDVKEIDQFLSEGCRRFGKIDAAIHCAYPHSDKWGARFEDLEPKSLNEDLEKQLGGAIIFSQRIIRLFREQGFGNLIHVASIQGMAAPKFDHYQDTSMVSPIEYSAIKSGIIAITRYLAKYTKGENIRVNCISPGGILDNQPDSFLKKYRDSCLNKGMLDSEDLTGTLLYLLSDLSQFVNGQNIVIDDGWSL